MSFPPINAHHFLPGLQLIHFFFMFLLAFRGIEGMTDIIAETQEYDFLDQLAEPSNM